MGSTETPTKVTMGRRQESLTSHTGFRAWVISVIGVSLIFAFQSFYPDLIGPISNVLPTICVAGAFISSFQCMRRYGFSLRLNFEAVWFLFALGFGVWVFAEATWAFYYFVLNVAVPYPSIADIFYMGGYIPIFFALAAYLLTFRPALTRRRMALALMAICAAVSLALAFVLPVELGQSLSSLNLLTDMAYPILDLSLLSLTIVSLTVFVRGAIAKWWALFGVGASLYVVGDEFFLYQVARGTYYNGSVDDLIFLLGYLTFALAFYAHRKEF